MFHFLSQAWSLLLSPSNALVALLAIGLALAALKGRPGFGGALAALAGTLLCAIAILPLGDLMLMALESRFPPPSTPPQQVAGIILLGGGVTLDRSSGTPHAQPNDASDRLFLAANLAREYPRAKVVAVGGPVDPATGTAEADFALGYLEKLGVPRSRILLERKSADTFENARNAATLLHPNAKENWLLVTSAFHMPRAIGAFRKAGFDPTPAPADYRAHGPSGRIAWSATGNLKAFDIAVRELVALAVYRQRGRTDDLFPKP